MGTEREPAAGPGAAARDLAARQAALVRALVAGGPAPDGLDGRRLAATARGLARKRARLVASHWPALRAVPDYETRYVAWAAGRVPGRVADDGAAFAASLGRELPLAAAVALVAARRRRYLRVREGVAVRWFGVRRIALRRRRDDGATPEE
jgi:hypothetical protein